MELKTTYIENARHRLVIGEHPDSCYIALSVDGASMGGFFTPAECMEAAGELIEIARRLKRR